MITMRVVDAGGNGTGDVQVYSGSWTSVAQLADSVIFDTDVTTTPQVHHMKVIGRFDESTPVYDVTVTNSAGQSFTATGLSHVYSGGTPTLGAGATGISFNTFLSTGDYLIDNAAIASARTVPGDADRDGDVDGSDARIMAAHWGTSVTPGDSSVGDFDGDGMVGPADASILAANWSPNMSEWTITAPEPGESVAILSAVLTLLWRTMRK
jgi:hypothetical protein